MNPGFLAVLLVACLLGLLPVWRLATAGWPPKALVTAWLVYTTALVLTVRFIAPMRFLVPILVLAYVAPFVAGPDRLSRVAGSSGRRARERRPVVDVTPRPAPGLPDGIAGTGTRSDGTGRDGGSHGSTPADGPGADGAAGRHE